MLEIRSVWTQLWAVRWDPKRQKDVLVGESVIGGNYYF